MSDEEAALCEIERGQSGAAVGAKTLIWFSGTTQRPRKLCSFNLSQQTQKVRYFNGSCVLVDNLALLFHSRDADLNLNMFVTLQPVEFNEFYFLRGQDHLLLSLGKIS